MTVQEQISRLNNVFERWHEEFDRMDQKRQKLETIYAGDVQQIKARFAAEKESWLNMREEILTFYRIARTSSDTGLQSEKRTPVKPDIETLNRMAQQVDISCRYDPLAEKVICMAGAYCAYVDQYLSVIEGEENKALQQAKQQFEYEANQINESKKRILARCGQYLRGDDFQEMVRQFSAIERHYEITPQYFMQWQQEKKNRQQKILFGFAAQEADIPRVLKPVLENSLGRYFDEQNNCICYPVGFHVSGAERLLVEYTDYNEKELRAGIMAILLNYIRHFSVSNIRVSLLDSIYYNGYLLGQLSKLAGVKKGMIDPVPCSSKEIEMQLKMLAAYYHKAEAKLGAQSAEQYNQTHEPAYQIPHRLLVINREAAKYPTYQSSEWMYLLNNAERLGIVVIELVKKSDAEGIGYLFGRQDLSAEMGSDGRCLYVRGDSMGRFYWKDEQGRNTLFRWLQAPENLPDTFITKIQKNMMPNEKGTAFFDRFPVTLPKRSKGKRKPIEIAFAVDEEDQPVRASFENEMFAAYMMGAARSGKSTLLHTIISGLVMNYHPDELELWLLDFKMLEFSRYMTHTPPHVKYVLLEKSEEVVFDIIDCLQEILEERKRIFSQNQWKKLEDVPPEVDMPAIFIIIDEFAQMSQILRMTKGDGYKADYTLKLENLLREGAAFGFKFIFASQTYSDGVEGLTEPARKQIQQRFALYNTPQEIKETLGLSSSMMTEALQNEICSLPVFESLFKWRDSSGEIRVLHLKNMYTRENEVEHMIDMLNQHMQAAENSALGPDRFYRDKHPVMIDGSKLQTFKSQVPFYKRYETEAKVSGKLNPEDVLVYPGVPRGFQLARPFALTNRPSENMLVTGGGYEYAMSVIVSVINSYRRCGGGVEFWAHPDSRVYKKYSTTLLRGFPCHLGTEVVCASVKKIKQQILDKGKEKKLVIVLGYERMAEEMALFGDADSLKAGRFKEPQESQADILRKIKNTQDVNEKKRLIAEYNASVSEKGKTSSDDAGICDVRKDLEWVLKRISMNDIHFLFGFEQAEDFVNTRMDVKVFHHQLVFHMTRADAAEIGCSKKAVELAKDTFMYTNGRDTWMMKPHFYHNIFG